MKALLEAIKTAIEAAPDLTYLTWVGVIENEAFVPEEPGFPLVGLVDGGVNAQSRPGPKDLESMIVGVVAFQSIALDDPGASITGSPHCKGVLEIGEDLKTLLNDNFLALPKVHFAHLGRHHAVRPLEAQSGFLVSKRFDYEYRRLV